MNIERELEKQKSKLSCTNFRGLGTLSVEGTSCRSPLHFDADNYVEREQKRNKEALNTCLSELRESMASDMLPTFNPVCHLVKGSHRDEIVRLAVSMEADLVVVGDLVHSGITSLIIESTALAISNHLDCSVLVVKPPDFITPVVVEEL